MNHSIRDTGPASIRTLAAVVCAVFLAAGCGGGGDDGPETSPLSFPIASAVMAYTQSAHQFNLSGTLDGVTFTMNYTYTPDAPATFEGKPASTAIKSMSLAANGMPAGDSSARSYFLLSPYTEYGAIDLGDGTYSVIDQTAPFPATARVGDTGPLGTETDYADSTKTTVVGSASASWSLEADSATTALFCINLQMAGGGDSGSECYRVDGSGNVTGMVVKVDVLGKQLTLR